MRQRILGKVSVDFMRGELSAVSFVFIPFVFPSGDGNVFSDTKEGQKQLWLLVASYYFYMSWNVQYGCLILLVTAIGYGGGLLLAQNKVRQGEETSGGADRQCSSVCRNPLFFKYSAFAVQNINELLRAVGSVRALKVPISFFRSEYLFTRSRPSGT